MDRIIIAVVMFALGAATAGWLHDLVGGQCGIAGVPVRCSDYSRR